MNSSLVFGLQRSSVFGKWTCSSVQVDYRFDPVRTLLAAAPHGGERRDNFARSLVRHRAGCQGRVAQSTDCDCRVSWCAHKPPRKAATPAPPPSMLQLRGIEGVQEGDYTSPFALTKILLEVRLAKAWLPRTLHPCAGVLLSTTVRCCRPGLRRSVR
jgi:hypothetical protein